MSRTMTIALLAVVVAVCAAVLLFAPSEFLWLRVIVGIPFLFLIPGQSAMLLVDTEARLAEFEWFTIAVSTSVAAVALLSVGLAATIGVSAPALVICLSFLDLLVLVASGLRGEVVGIPELQPTSKRNPIRLGIAGVLTVMASALFILAISISLPGVEPSHEVVQLWGLRDKTSGGLRIGVNNVDSTSTRFRLSIQQADRVLSQATVTVPKGSGHVFVVRPSALTTTRTPVVAIMTDPTGVVATHTVSVWATP